MVVTAQAVGTGYNTPSNGSSLQTLSVVPYVSTTILDSKPTGGLNAETDAEFFTRAVTILKSYSTVMVTEEQIQAHILVNYTGTVYRAKAYNLRRYADRNMVTGGGSHTGYVLVSVAGENVNGYPRSVEDATITASNVSDITTAITSKIATGLTIEIHNAELIGIGITCEVYKTTSAAAGTVSDAVQTALETYLDADAWDWDRVVRVNEVISLLDNVAGVDYVKVVTLSLPEESVVGATTANLTATYDNGTLGVGATLTNSSTQAVFGIDGLTPTVASRVLVKDQTAAAQNGIYEVTVVGDGSTNWVLTRATTSDTVNEMVVDRFVWVVGGTAEAQCRHRSMGCPLSCSTADLMLAILLKSA
mgnify:CR=1 FL=1